MTSSNHQRFSELLQSIESGRDPLAVEFRALSDLDREEAQELTDAWPRVPEALRESILQRAAELAEDNVEFDFGRLARVALDDASPQVRLRAAEMLWENEDRDVAQRLTEMLRADPDSAVRAAAAKALRPFVLMREFETFDRAQGDAVVEGLRQSATDEGEDLEVRARAVESLGPRALPWVEGIVTEAYYHDDSRLRLAAIRAMGDSADERWLEYLEEQVHSDDAAFRYETAIAYGSIGSEDAVEPLAELLEDEDSEVQIAALQALGEVGGKEAVELLQDFRRRAPEGLEEVAASALEAAKFVGAAGGEEDEE